MIDIIQAVLDDPELREKLDEFIFYNGYDLAEGASHFSYLADDLVKEVADRDEEVKNWLQHNEPVYDYEKGAFISKSGDVNTYWDIFNRLPSILREKAGW